MNVRINDPRVDELAEELAKRTGEDPTALVIRALEERLRAEPAPQDEAPQRKPLSEAEIEAKKAEIMEILARIDKLPVLDARSPDEMLYDENGLPC